MDDSKEICCLCLSSSNIPLIDLFSKSGEHLTYYDKISSSLSLLANELNDSGCSDYMHIMSVCGTCCDNIEMVYKFNCTCLENVKRYICRKEIFKIENTIGKEECNDSIMESNNQSENTQNTEKIFIKSESGFSDCQVNNASVDNKKISEDSIMKQEEQHVPNLMDICQVDMQIEETNIVSCNCCQGANLEAQNDIQPNLPTYIAAREKSFTSNSEGVNRIDQLTQEQIIVFKREERRDQRAVEQISIRSTSEPILVPDKHVHWDRKAHTCQICVKSFANKSHLEVHMRIHSGVKPFTCHICDKPFNHKSNLNSHLLLHSADKVFTCDVCEQTFRQKKVLDQHRLIHTGAKPFSCAVCDREFRCKSVLNRHMRIHSDERPFVCYICNRAFRIKNTLTQHIKVHSEDKQFPCDVCTKSFSKKANLIRHKHLHERSEHFMD